MHLRFIGLCGLFMCIIFLIFLTFRLLLVHFTLSLLTLLLNPSIVLTNFSLSIHFRHIGLNLENTQLFSTRIVAYFELILAKICLNVQY